MAKKRPTRRRSVLQGLAKWFTPEECLTFIELPPFTRRWNQLDLDDKELANLQIGLMVDPKAAPVIEGTGGTRKLRYSPSAWEAGKSGALRVIYKYCEEVGTIVLGVVYKKGEQVNLDDNQKRALRLAVERVERALLARTYRAQTRHTHHEL
jgi:hypothetical protein